MTRCHKCQSIAPGSPSANEDDAEAGAEEKKRVLPTFIPDRGAGCPMFCPHNSVADKSRTYLWVPVVPNCAKKSCP